MPVYDNKTDFLSLGIEVVVQSIYHSKTNCTICLEPLDMVETTPSTGSADHDHGSDQDTPLHAAVRIKACNHVHGAECLAAWLEVGNTCPICNRMLFVPPFEEPITQDVVDDVIQALRDVAYEEDISDVLARLVFEDQTTGATRRQQFEAKVAAQRKQTEAQERNREFDDFLLYEDDFLDSDVEDWFPEDYEGDENEDSGEDGDDEKEVEEDEE